MAFERIRARRDTTAAWAMTNPVLGLGELGIDVTLQKVKAGDGLRPWNELPFLSETEIVNTLDSARTDAALSAAQGKALKQSLNNCALARLFNKAFYVATDGDDSTADGSEAKPFRTLRAAVAAIPALSPMGCGIKIKPGVYVEIDRVDINFINVESISIAPAKTGDDVTIKTTSPKGILATWGASCNIEIKNLKFQGADDGTTKVGIQPGRCQVMVIQDCEISGVTEGIAAFYSTVNVKNTTINATLNCIRAGALSQVFAEGNQGTARYGLASHSGIIYKTGTQPTGTIANEQKINGGQIW